MAAEIRLTKADESPWGFRLTGGRDFATPLTIVKVCITLCIDVPRYALSIVYRKLTLVSLESLERTVQ